MDDNPITIYWRHDAVSNSESMVDDYDKETLLARADDPAILYIAEHADGTREVVDPGSITDPAAANTRTGTLSIGAAS